MMTEKRPCHFEDAFGERLQHLLKRAEAIDRQLAHHDLSTDSLASLAKEKADLEPIVEIVKRLRQYAEDLADLKSLAEADASLAESARTESQTIKEAASHLGEELQRHLLPKDAADARNVIIEIRHGTGGGEAALFAKDLWTMYARYAERKGWKTELLSLNQTDLRGVKEVIFAVKGQGAFAHLKFESGVHRVQRVPETEAGGRVHTSAATVAVLPEAEAVDVMICPEDLRIDTYRASGAGGQHVNKTESAVRITHLPSGVVAQCQDEKSQHKNKAQAMKMLRARLYDKQREEADAQRASQRKTQVGSGDRSQRIRTYNVLQGRVTDHRINLTLHQIEAILGGNLDTLIDALMQHDQAERLAKL